MFKTTEKCKFSSHMKRLQYNCVHCGYTFKSKNYLDKHVNENHDCLVSPSFTCGECMLKTTEKSKCSYHMKRLHYKCDQWWYTFTNKNELDKHMNENHDWPVSPSFTCEECMFKTTEKSKFIDHMRIHFKCVQFEYTFMNESDHD